MKNTTMFRTHMPLGKTHGRTIITGIQIMVAGSTMNNGATSMSRGTILRMTVGTYDLIIGAVKWHNGHKFFTFWHDAFHHSPYGNFVAST